MLKGSINLDRQHDSAANLIKRLIILYLLWNSVYFNAIIRCSRPKITFFLPVVNKEES